jgi:hypothetical protein
MRYRFILPIALLLCFATAAYADHAKDQNARLDEIVSLIQDGVSDAVIVKHIRNSGFVFELAADDLVQLRDLGLSDTVLEALLDTAQDDNGYDPVRYRSDAYFSLSAGYFSPWYQYPYAWGFYYDPFPVCYSSYYYPFNWRSSWGYYGGCHYYNQQCWGSSRWDNPRYWVASRHNQGRALRVSRPVLPRRVEVMRTARGLQNHRSIVPHAGTMPPRFVDRGESRQGAELRQRIDRSHPWTGRDPRLHRSVVPAAPPDPDGRSRGYGGQMPARHVAPPAQHQPPQLRQPYENPRPRMGVQAPSAPIGNRSRSVAPSGGYSPPQRATMPQRTAPPAPSGRTRSQH